MNMKKMIISTTPILDGYKVKSYLGVVNVNIVIGTNFFSDFAASFTDVFGGNSGTYQRKMDLMYEEAKDGLERKTRRLGGNAILGFKIDFDEISGKGKSMFMLSASGTACLIDMPNSGDKILNKDTDKVPSEFITQELQKRNICNKIADSPREITDEDWNFITNHSDAELLELILKKTYYSLNTDTIEQVHQMASLLDYDEACKIVYPLYSNPFLIQSRNSYGDIVEEDVSSEYSTLIRACRLFNAENICSIIDTDLEKAIDILDCEKPYYDDTDLKYMKKICEKLNNLPDVGKKEVIPGGMFSKEKEVYICRHNHINESGVDFCLECNENIKGLTEDETLKIEEFKFKTEILSQLINESE